MNGDLINAIFELGGGILCWLNVRRLLKDRIVKGISWPVQAFFASWGIWNLYYYPSLGQYLSLYGGIFLVASNITWVVLAIRFREKNG